MGVISKVAAQHGSAPGASSAKVCRPGSVSTRSYALRGPLLLGTVAYGGFHASLLMLIAPGAVRTDRRNFDQK